MLFDKDERREFYERMSFVPTAPLFLTVNKNVTPQYFQLTFLLGLLDNIVVQRGFMYFCSGFHLAGITKTEWIGFYVTPELLLFLGKKLWSSVSLHVPTGTDKKYERRYILNDSHVFVYTIYQGVQLNEPKLDYCSGNCHLKLWLLCARKEGVGCFMVESDH